jgi:hypothetical protein
LLFECGSDYRKIVEIKRPKLYELLTAELGYEIYTLLDFLFDKGPLRFDEFRRCGRYPFRGFTFIARPASTA